jgi:hypothetical protein
MAVIVAVARGEAAAADPVQRLDALYHMDGEGQPRDPGPALSLVAR